MVCHLLQKKKKTKNPTTQQTTKQAKHPTCTSFRDFCWICQMTSNSNCRQSEMRLCTTLLIHGHSSTVILRPRSSCNQEPAKNRTKKQQLFVPEDKYKPGFPVIWCTLMPVLTTDTCCWSPSSGGFPHDLS